MLEYFENEMWPYLICPTSFSNFFTRIESQFLFTWCSAEAALKDLISCEKLKYVSRIVWEIGGDLLSRRGISNKFSISSNNFAILQLSDSKIYFVLNLI